MPETELKKAYTVNEALEALGIGRFKLYGLLNSGEIVARKSGRRTLIEAAEIERWLAALPEYQPRQNAA